MAKKNLTARELALDLEGALAENVDRLKWITSIMDAILLAHSTSRTGDMIPNLIEAARYLAEDQTAIAETTIDQLHEVLA